MKKFCPKCGTELQDTAGFCPKCGAPTGFHHEENNQQEPHRRQGTNKKSLYALLIVLGIIVLFGGAAILYSEFAEKREARLARERFVADSIMKVKKDSLRQLELKEQARQDSIAKALEIENKLKYLSKLYKQLWHYYNDNKRYDNYIAGNITNNCLTNLRNECLICGGHDSEHCESCRGMGDTYALVRFGQDGPNVFQPFITIYATKEDNDIFIVETKIKSLDEQWTYDIASDDIDSNLYLKVVKVNGTYKIDDFMWNGSYTKDSKSIKITGETTRMY